jgi:mannosyltransferase OCH1-like enzyme
VLRYDALRPFLLHHYGGLYLDVDTECYRDMTSSIAGQVRYPHRYPHLTCNTTALSRGNNEIMLFQHHLFSPARRVLQGFMPYMSGLHPDACSLPDVNA